MTDKHANVAIVAVFVLILGAVTAHAMTEARDCSGTLVLGVARLVCVQELQP